MTEQYRSIRRAEWAADRIIGQLAVSSAKRLRVFGEDSMLKVKDLGHYFVDMAERARKRKS